MTPAEVTDRFTKMNRIPVGIDCHATGGNINFTLLSEIGPPGDAFAGTDLSGAEVAAVLRHGNRIVDYAAHPSLSTFRYAAIFVPDGTPQQFVEDVSERDIKRIASRFGAHPVKIRYCGGADRPHYSAVLCRKRSRGERWSWHADIDADAVSYVLRKGFDGVVDFHAFKGDSGVRFNLVTSGRQCQRVWPNR
ncbi:hypothetical protein [Streptomyces sp. RKAG293]|uniref:hypothetical protein n=1 Tax=Streptomyces sp. RKAG293 TaxID=2893403 RepID=UPI002033D9FB|nr:hypothetical protein [Streptomyces sp. RKAG293]MCM2416587.1 hypothetical protein [Streptomyces sp. RKAG293]